MNAEILFNEIGLINGKFIIEADTEILNLNLKSKKRKWRILMSSAVSILLVICIFTVMPVLAANPAIYEIIYSISPGIAQYFVPIQESCEDNGIKMEVVSVYIHENIAEIYVTLQDLTENRIDETTDLFNSYSINRSFSSIDICERVGFETDTKTATFLISIIKDGNRKITEDKITFSVRQFISGKKVYDNIPLTVDLSNISNDPNTMPMSFKYGGGFSGDMSLFEDNPIVLTPSAPFNFDVDGIEISSIGYIDDMLHIQTVVKNYFKNDNHGYFYFKDKKGNEINYIYTVGFNEYQDGERIRYSEYVFDIPQSELDQYEIYGYFVTSDSFTEGNWRVTFPLIIKEKNVFQRAADEGIDVSTLEEYADFAFTPFEEEAERANERIYANDKEKIYDMMLNSIDYYNTLDISFTTSMLAGENVLVHCETDIDKSISYQAIYNNEKLLDEIISDGLSLTRVNHEIKTIEPFYLDSKTRKDAFPIDLSERIEIMPDGLPCFNYRVNATNCTMASFCIFPQEIVFSYLKNFDLWEITGNDEYLGRKCLVINGTPTDYTATKHDVDKFTMYVDDETGILLKFTGTQNGEETTYIKVEKCSFDNIDVKQNFSNEYDTSKYIYLNR